jgi:prevent-host-death family protein
MFKEKLFTNQILSVTEAKPKLASLTNYVAEEGAEVILTKRGKPSVAILPYDHLKLLKTIIEAKQKEVPNIEVLTDTLRNGLKEANEGIDFKNEEEMILWWEQEKKSQS